MPRFVEIAQTASTNSLMLSQAPGLAHGTVIFTPCQTAGRGQRGNRWLAAPGQNATFSMLLRPASLAARDQFVVSEVASLAVCDTLSSLSGRDDLRVKWPNDVYCGDRKICGILIENSLRGVEVDYAVVGIGINVNQREFDPYAPNPTSLALIARGEFDPVGVMAEVCRRIERQWAGFEADPAGVRVEVHRRYVNRLYRHDGGFYPFALPDGTAFDACIAGVEPDGTLGLRLADGTVNTYAFKQVQHIINNTTL